MIKSSIVSQITWQNLLVKVVYTPIYFDMDRVRQDDVLSYWEIHCDQPLPISKTGFKCHFFFQNKDQICSSFDAKVIQMLDEAAQSKEWQLHLIKQMQPSLF